MKLILLPGMDGTGQLFLDVLEELGDVDTYVVSLPRQGPQDYESLSHYVSGLLPDEDYIILAESFSGGIAALLSEDAGEHLRGIIFVASFLSSPVPFWSGLAKLLPLKLMISLPFSSFIIRVFLLGWRANVELIERFRHAVLSVPTVVLKSRLSVIAKSRYSGFRSEVPVVYIGAGRDIFIGIDKRHEFAAAYPNITFTEVDGPHFLLQARSKEAAVVIHSALKYLVRK